MKIFIVESPTAKKILDTLKSSGFKEEDIEIVASSEIEKLASGHHIVILAEDVQNPIYPLMAYCNQFRSPEHGKIPLVILNDNNSYKELIDDFLGKDYRKDRPDVPTDESLDSNFVVFKKRKEDFFLLSKSNELANIVTELQKKNGSHQVSILAPKQENTITPEHPKVKKLFENNVALNFISTPQDFKNSISLCGKSAVTIGAAAGTTWDANGRSELYKHIGENIAKLGYSLISGGADGDGKASGPLYHSATGAAKAKGSLSACYTNWIFEKFVSPEILIALELKLLNISFVPNEAVRKQYLIEPADIVIVFPGAIGTHAEILASIATGKPILLFNVWIEERNCYYYDNFYKLLEKYQLTHNVHLIKVDPKMGFEEVRTQIESVTVKLDTVLSEKEAFEKKTTQSVLSTHHFSLINKLGGSKTEAQPEIEIPSNTAQQLPSNQF